MSQMNTGVDNSMRNHNPWISSNTVIPTWLNAPQQMPIVSFYFVKLKIIFNFGSWYIKFVVLV